MSRSKKKLAIIHDLQCKHGDIILTKNIGNNIELDPYHL